MKKLCVALLALTMVVGIGVSTSLAEAYISGSVGAVILNDADIEDDYGKGEMTFDTGIGFVGAVGSRSTGGNNNRIELEVGYRTNDFDKIKADGYSVSIDGDITTISLMGNIYLDIPTSGKFSPFIGGGVGYANIEGDLDSFGTEDDNVFAYQLILGGSIAASRKLYFDLQYRFFGTEDPDFDGLEAEYTTHNLMIGLRHNF